MFEEGLIFLGISNLQKGVENEFGRGHGEAFKSFVN